MAESVVSAYIFGSLFASEPSISQARGFSFLCITSDLSIIEKIYLEISSHPIMDPRTPPPLTQ